MSDISYAFPEFSHDTNRVYEAVRDGNLSTEEVAEQIPDVDPLTIGRYLRRLAARGVLRRVTRGVYEVA